MIALEEFSTPILAANDNVLHMIKTPFINTGHIPVMLEETLDYLQPKDGGIYLDATFGHGGYTQAILNSADCVVYAIDRDPDAEKRASALVAEYGSRFRFIRGCFGEMESMLTQLGVGKIDGVCFDLGVASSQLDVAERGFSFRQDGPLNMRMDGGRPNAADVIAAFDLNELSDIISTFGEEKHAYRVAKAIVEARKAAPIITTNQLADIVRSVVPRSKDGIDPATRTFQALRIYVNDELSELETGLSQAERLLAPGGRLVAVSYHSLEDRIVKDFLRTRSGRAPNVSRHMPVVTPLHKPTFDLITRKALPPTSEESSRNARAASAKLRAAERTASPVWPTIATIGRTAQN